MNDRIKLAEAMGWRSIVNSKGIPPRHERFVPIPDPENDANDDYAVLEWLRKDSCIPITFSEKKQHYYQIGDYARAALKELERVQTIPAQKEPE